MIKINENQILTNVRLGIAQKYVLAKIFLPTQTPLTAFSSVSDDENVVAARETLEKLGMIGVNETKNEAWITEKGKAALRNENLIDDMDNLTPAGEQFAYAKTFADAEKIAAQEKSPELPSPEQSSEVDKTPSLPMGISPNSEQPLSLESCAWSMIAAMQERLSEAEFKRLYMQEWKSDPDYKD
jgi:hypothetical protein